jgi:hypothetical protein
VKLYDLATVIRSKNAGPFTVTIDLLFQDRTDLQRVLDAPGFSAMSVAELYHMSLDMVRIYPFERALAIKVSLPRPVSSGAPGDVDVYGSQQHTLLGQIEV